MAESSQRKTYFLLALAFSLVVALVALVLDDELRDKLGTTYYVIGLAIIGSVLLVLAGYVWDRTLMDRLKTLRTTMPVEVRESDSETDHD